MQTSTLSLITSRKLSYVNENIRFLKQGFHSISGVKTLRVDLFLKKNLEVSFYFLFVRETLVSFPSSFLLFLPSGENLNLEMSICHFKSSLKIKMKKLNMSVSFQEVKKFYNKKKVKKKENLVANQMSNGKELQARCLEVMENKCVN